MEIPTFVIEIRFSIVYIVSGIAERRRWAVRGGSNTLIQRPPSPIGGGLRRYLEAFMIPGQARISLSELRRKTDIQLVALVRREIESSVRLAGRGASAEAEAVWNQARSLLAVAGAPESERIALEARLDEARAKFSVTGAAATVRCAQSAWC